MTKHTIEIEGLPEGWEPVEYRVPNYGEFYISRFGVEEASDNWPERPAAVIVQKTKPREITLVETDEDNIRDYEDMSIYETQWFERDNITLRNQPKIWRVKEES